MQGVYRNIPSLQKQYLLFPCSHSALAKAYGISRNSLYKRLKKREVKLGPRTGNKYSLEQLFIIVSLLGWPPLPIPEK
jgi:hypothetical protein